MMKAGLLALLLILPPVVCTAGVTPGESLDEVRAALGVPRGQLRVGDRHLLYYDRGEVELTAGTVTRISLLNDEEYANREARRAGIAERVREENASRTAAGEALKARLLASTTFRNAPPNYQVAFWEDFARRYPGVSCAEELAFARVTLTDQLEEKRARDEQEARLAELEARVAAAEAQTSAEAFYGYPVRSHHRGYRTSAPSFWPVVYHFNDSATPATSFPRTSPSVPAYRHPFPRNDNPHNDWRDASRHGRERGGDADYDMRRSGSRNRF